MAIPFEAYTGEGVLTGLLDAPGPIREALETSDAVRLAPCHGVRLDGRSAEWNEAAVPTDDLLLVVPDRADTPVHASWHDVRLIVGPYFVEGQLPTQPGFDPGRALARPTGSFVLLRETTIRSAADPGQVLAVGDGLLVNRYAVDEVDADLMLGFFFPGARLVEHAAPTPLAAGVGTHGPPGPADGAGSS